MTERKQSFKMAQYPTDESAQIRKAANVWAGSFQASSKPGLEAIAWHQLGRAAVGQEAEPSVVDPMKMKQHSLRQKNSSQLCQHLFTKPSNRE